METTARTRRCSTGKGCVKEESPIDTGVDQLVKATAHRRDGCPCRGVGTEAQQSYPHPHRPAQEASAFRVEGPVVHGVWGSHEGRVQSDRLGQPEQLQPGHSEGVTTHG